MREAQVARREADDAGGTGGAHGSWVLLLALLGALASVGWYAVRVAQESARERHRGPPGEIGPEPRLTGAGTGEGPRTVSGVAPRLPPAPTLSLRVADERGAPVRDALAYLLPLDVPGADALPSGTPRALTAADGSATLAAEGAWALGVQASGFAPQVQRVDLGRGDLRALDVVLRREGRVTGRVVHGSSGEPLEDARVYCATDLAAGERAWLHPGLGGRPRVEDLAFADPTSARFAVDGLPEGAYALTGAAAGFLPGTLRGVRPGDDVELRLSPSAVLRIRVRDWRGGPRDVLAARVRVRGTSEVVTGAAQLGAPGELDVREGLAPGDYDVDVERVGVAHATVPATVAAAGEVVGVEVDLAPLAALDLEAAGDGDLHGFLRILPSTGDPPEVRLATGRVTTVALRGGRYRIEFRGPEAVADPVDVDLAEGERRRLPLTLRRPTRVHVGGDTPAAVTCVGSDGRPRLIALFRREPLLVLEERVVAEAGDLLVLAPEPGLRLEVAGHASRSFPLEPGRDHDLTAAGLAPRD